MTDQPIEGFPLVTAIISQWRARTLHMINWGGYNGYHRVDLDTPAVLISGASGTGKSTMQDAYTALMNDYNVPFNGASNATIVGRARSAENRNVLSYVRGKIDETRDEDTNIKDQVLRGATGDTWSAVAMTWINDDGTLFTAMRLYYAPGTATAQRDVRTTMASYPDDFNLANVEQFAVISPPFFKPRMRSTFPDLTFHDTYAQFSAALYKRLEIGKNGDGQAALRLLARIQGGRHVASVDSLFKDLVLETPATYDVADKAIERFDKLESAWDTMRDAQKQINTLAEIPRLYENLVAARQDADLIDTFRIDQPIAEASTALALWAHRAEADVLDTEIASNRVTNGDATAEHARSSAAAAVLGDQIDENKRSQWNNGGGALEDVRRRIGTQETTVATVRVERARFAEATARFGPCPATQDAFTAWSTAAAAFLAAYPDASAALRAEVELIADERAPVRAQQHTLLEEQSWLRGRRDLIPADLDRTRQLYSETSGVDPADLPFVAELIDIHPDHAQWREAAELLLGGFAKTMLVDRAVGREFRARINPVKNRRRTDNNYADPNRPMRTLDPATLPGRLIFRDDSPFVGWLQAELDRRFAYVCVADTSGFRDDRRSYITLTGQTQSGDRGSHGGHGAAPILGFSNEARLATIETELEALEPRLAEFQARLDSVGVRSAALDADRAAHQRVADTTWDRIDEAGAQTVLDEAREEEEQYLDEHAILKTLRNQLDVLKAKHAEESKTATLTKHQMELLEAEWIRLVDRQDAVKDRLEYLDLDGIVISDEQQARLDTAFADMATTLPVRWHEFGDTLKRMTRSLTQHVAQARERASEAEASLTRVFAAYQAQWPDNNVGTTMLSHDHYRGILDTLLAEGLAERRDRFTHTVLEWSGQDLLSLAGSYQDAERAIQERLNPVNSILETIPFGPGQDRLTIKKRTERTSDVNQFRQELRSLASNTTTLTSSEQIEARFKMLQRFIRRLRKGTDGTGERDYLLDVRRHIHIDAERVDPITHVTLGVYDNLGGKSGGETQELIAFIVGAALRYQLGNEFDAKPVYAPVFLDEAFIKADSQFAGRAVNAWRRLGFQLIVAAPLDKVTAIEPYTPRMYVVTKTLKGHSQIKPLDRVPPVVRGREAAR